MGVAERRQREREELRNAIIEAAVEIVSTPLVAVSSQQPIQREVVVYPNGKYVLHGDGVTQAWHWMWIPTAPPPPPAAARSEGGKEAGR